MKFVELSLAYKDEWNRIAYNSNDAWLFHLYEWLPLTENLWDLESKSFLVEHQDKFVGIFPLQLKRRSKNLWSIYMGTGGPALIDNLDDGVRKKILKGMFGHVREIAMAHQSPSIEILLSPLSRSSLGAHRNINPLIHYFYKDVSTHTWIVDLSLSGEDIFNHYSDDARRSVRKAQEKGYTVAPLTNLSDLDKYYDVHCQTTKRTGIPSHPKEYFLEIYKNFCNQGLAVVWEARNSEGKSVAFEIVAMFKQSALYWMGCCQTEHLDSGVNYLLQHHSMMWAKDQGARWFENGEAFPNVEQGKLRGLTLFKGKFGGELHRFYKGRIELIDQTASKSAWKDWVRASVGLLKPLIKEEGVQKIESKLSVAYKRIKHIWALKRRFVQVQYLKPYWHWKEFWAGFSYSILSDKKAVEKMEDAFRKTLNIQGALFATSSGRTALELALRVIKKGNPQKMKVIITTYGCRGVFDPVVNAGLQPIFADINQELNLSDDFVERLLKSHGDALAIVIPHLCGKAEDVANLVAMAKKNGLIIIEDVCQSLGSKVSFGSLGSQYDMSIFSFGIGKNLMATAGGMLVSRILEKDLTEEYKSLGQEDDRIVKKRFLKIFIKYFMRFNINFNQEVLSAYRYCKTSSLDAHLMTVQLKQMDTMIEKQRRNAHEIISSLKKTNLRFHLQEDPNHIYSKFAIIFDDVKDCTRLEKSLHKALIETEEMYTPLHLRDFSLNFLNGGEFPFAEAIYKNIFNIPVRPNLKQRELNRIKKAIESVDA